KPGRLSGIAHAAQAQPFALADGVVNEPVVLADGLAVECAPRNANRAGLAGQMLAQEAFEITLADKTDAGAVRLVMHGQAVVTGNGAYFRLVQFAQREQRPGQRPGRNSSQEVALILARIDATQQLRVVSAVLDTGVMAGGDGVRTEAFGMVQKRIEL